MEWTPLRPDRSLLSPFHIAIVPNPSLDFELPPVECTYDPRSPPLLSPPPVTLATKAADVDLRPTSALNPLRGERYYTSTYAKAACKEAASLRKDPSAARAKLAEVKEHAVDLTEIQNGLRKAARDLAAAIRTRRGEEAVHEPCDDKLVERDAPLADGAVLQAFVAGLWDTLGRVAHLWAQKEAAWARSEVEDSTRVPSTSNSLPVAQLPSYMPLQSADLLRAMSGGLLEVGFDIARVAMKRISEEEVLVEKYNAAKEENARLTWTHDQLVNVHARTLSEHGRMQECMTISRALSCNFEPAEDSDAVSTPSAIGGNELDASQSTTLTSDDVDAPSTSATAIPSPAKVVDSVSARNSAIATILGGTHLLDDISFVTFPRTEIQHLSGGVKAVRAALDVACISRIGGGAPLRTALHDVASTRADSHAACEGAKGWKRKYAKWKVECDKREADSSKWREALVKAHMPRVQLTAEVEEPKTLGIGMVSGPSETAPDVSSDLVTRSTPAIPNRA
ncbi:hypothetical protein EV715DRAFT_297724 [Schizophyllum commune]